MPDDLDRSLRPTESLDWTSGSRSMEYLRDRGTRDDVPFDEVMDALAEHDGFDGAAGPVADPTFLPTGG